MAAKCKAAAQEAHAKEMEPQRKGQQKPVKAAPAKAQVSRVHPAAQYIRLRFLGVDCRLDPVDLAGVR